ncbi:hypothetical protein C3433_24015 [Citrobacter freundii]|nr:hypothetical protein C3433_24015 [Citrobacter freundii]
MRKRALAVLALAATAVSGSVMAWEGSGSGGSLDLNGTLTPQKKVIPWEVIVGSAVSDLNAEFAVGATVVEIPVTKSITALGIRTISKDAFMGQTGIAPQVDFKNAVDLSGFSEGVTTLTLDVKDSADTKIGVLTAPFSTAAVVSLTGSGSSNTQQSLNAPNAKDGFFGGLSTGSGGINSSAEAKALISKLNPEIVENYNPQSLSEGTSSTSNTFNMSGGLYSAMYGAGIEVGKTIKLTLSNPANSALAWKASLPVTVSYQ